MAHQRGTRDKRRVAKARPGRAMPAGVRLVGTVILGGLGMAIIAVTTLVPPYASLKSSQYERNREAAAAAYLQAQVDANERVLAAAEGDPVFIKRLAISQGTLVPTDEIAFGPVGTSAAPDVVIPPAPPPLKPPPQWLIATANRIEQPGMSRGLYLLGVGVLLATMLLFAHPLHGPAQNATKPARTTRP